MPNKRTIIFIHGAWHGPWCWEHFFIPFFSHRFNTLCLEYVGRNFTSSLKKIHSLSIHDYAKDIKTKINNINHDPIIICHSMGSYLLQLILKDIRKPAAVIFIAPVPVNGALKPFLKVIFKNPLGFLKSVITLDSSRFFSDNKVAKKLLFSNDTSSDEIKQFQGRLQNESLKAISYMIFNSYKNVVPGNIPSLVLASNIDIFSTQNEATKVAELFNSDLHVFQNIGHDMMLDKKWKIVANFCLEWIQSNVNLTFGL